MHQSVDPITTDYSGLPKAFIHEKLCIECGQCQSQCRFDAISHEHVKKRMLLISMHAKDAGCVNSFVR